MDEGYVLGKRAGSKLGLKTVLTLVKAECYGPGWKAIKV
jgi:hypothetical protein